MKLIDKSALVAEIKRRRESNAKDRHFGRLVEDNYFLDFLGTLEVKEVDLKKELKTLDDTLFDLDGVAVKGATHYLTVEDVKDIAKHFFELGLKAQKGEEV